MDLAGEDFPLLFIKVCTQFGWSGDFYAKQMQRLDPGLDTPETHCRRIRSRAPHT